MLTSVLKRSLPLLSRPLCEQAGSIDLGASAETGPSLELPKKNYWSKGIDWYTKYESPVSRKLYESFLPFIQLDKARRVLDIGAGVGEGAELIIPKSNELTTFVLSNDTEEFNEIIKSKNFERCETSLSSPTEIPFPGEFFDRLLCISTINRVEDPFLFFREAFRLTAPNGIFVMSILGRRTGTTRNEILDVVRERFGVVTPFISRSKLSNPGKIKGMMKKIGFKRVICFYESYEYPSTDIEELMEVFLNEPGMKHICEQGHTQVVKDILREELHKVLHVEESTLNYESLMLLGAK